MTEGERFQAALTDEYMVICSNFANQLGILFTTAEMQFIRTQIANAISQSFNNGLQAAAAGARAAPEAFEVKFAGARSLLFSTEDLQYIAKQISEAMSRAYDGGYQNGEANLA